MLSRLQGVCCTPHAGLGRSRVAGDDDEFTSKASRDNQESSVLVYPTRGNFRGDNLRKFDIFPRLRGVRALAPYSSLVPRPNPLTRKGSGVTSLNPWACGSVEAL